VDEADTTLKQLKETYALKRAAGAAAVHIVEIQRTARRPRWITRRGTQRKWWCIRRCREWLFTTRFGSAGEWERAGRRSGEAGRAVFAGCGPVADGSARGSEPSDFRNVHLGQKAEMHLDAYPGLALPATLEQLSPLGHKGQFNELVRTFAMQFTVQGQDARLLPDLSAALDLDLGLGSASKELVVPRQSVACEEKKCFAWVKGGSAFDKREVKVGRTNDLEAVIVSGLAEGDVVRSRLDDANSAAEKP